MMERNDKDKELLRCKHDNLGCEIQIGEAIGTGRDRKGIVE